MDEEEYLHQIAQLRHEIFQMRKQHDEEVTDLKKQLLDTHREIKELKRRLAVYDNAHTPPSKQRFREKEEKTDDEEKRRGRPPGHEGSTRETPEPTEKVEATEKKCPDCHQALGAPAFFETKIIEEIPAPAPLRIIQFRIAHYNCKCGRHIEATHPDLPKAGRFGPQLQTEIAEMKIEDRLPFRKIRAALSRKFGISISPATLLEIEGKVAAAVAPEYEKLKTRVRLAKSVHCDETTFRVDGDDWWLWVFATDDCILFVIRRTRSGSVVDEILGKDFGGIIVADGFSAYQHRGLLQRCWAHLIRELEEAVKEFTIFKPLLLGLRKTFHDLKIKLASVSSQAGRRELFQWGMKELGLILDMAKAQVQLKKFSTYLGNGMPHWLTFILYPGVEPTNNRAEQALRELIVIRKIIGTLRCQKGADTQATLSSMCATWHAQGRNSREGLLAALRS